MAGPCKVPLGTDKRKETRDKRQDTRDKRQETRDKTQERPEGTGRKVKSGRYRAEGEGRREVKSLLSSTTLTAPLSYTLMATQPLVPAKLSKIA